jgi:hypothetical protein
VDGGLLKTDGSTPEDLRVDLLPARGERLGERSEHRHPDERHDLRPEPLDLVFEEMPSLDVLGRAEVVDPRARTRHEVRHPETPLRQADVVDRRDRFRHET